MKILHMCLGNFYIDNYSYQENLLPKFHKKMGLDVEIIASLTTFDENGELTILKHGRKKYVNENGIPVTRIEYKNGGLNKKLRRYVDTYESINQISPDIIFIHGCQFLDVKEVAKYIQNNPSTKVYVDNHADFSNSATNWLSKNILHRIIWRHCAKIINPYAEKFYGVLPARVKFLKEMYKIPSNKVELLVMGADDEKITASNQAISREKIRKKYKISEDDFLIITGGKIDLFKRQVIDLMNAIIKLDKPGIKLLVYGSIVNEMKTEVEKLVTHKSIEYIGWINNETSYEVFAAADLFVFPGRHSVYWEQVVAMGKPLIVKYWEGTTHIDIGGNCIFLQEDSEDEIYNVLKDLLSNTDKYSLLMDSAGKKGKNQFLYSEIAKKSLENLDMG